ncbi:MAG: hypothetical protein H6815_04675 [Phycisphaeraceae bacterium]|nr:hypothetical protein [Phycisphaerales bacterium]MCB9859728.1 hypothetical protein [Phycisphaeraceae bacterium]
MRTEILHSHGNTHVRRLTLEPGESTHWHTDPHHRVTVVLRGSVLQIEFRDGSKPEHVPVAPGQVDWDEPLLKPHRGVNIGDDTYEEVVIFQLHSPDDVVQPQA